MESSLSQRPRRFVLKLAALSTIAAAVVAATRDVDAQANATTPLAAVDVVGTEVKGTEMNAEQDGTGVEVRHLVPQPVASIRATVRIADLAGAMDERVIALRDYLARRGVRPAGPPFARYHTFGETETDLEFGVPVAAPVAPEGRIGSSELPGGPAIATWHPGPHDTLAGAYARMEAWREVRDVAPDGAAWEVYYWLDPVQYRGPASLPDPATWQTLLVQPIKGSAPQ